MADVARPDLPTSLDADLLASRNDASVSISAAQDYAGGFAPKATAQAFKEDSKKFKGVASKKIGVDFTGDRAGDTDVYQKSSSSGGTQRDKDNFKWDDGSGIEQTDMATVKQGKNSSQTRVDDADLYVSSAGAVGTYQWTDGSGIKPEEEEGPVTSAYREDDFDVFRSGGGSTRKAFDWGDNTAPPAQTAQPAQTVAPPPHVPPKTAVMAPKVELPSSTVDAVDAMLSDRGIYADSGVVDFENALMHRTETEDHQRPRTTVYKGRQNLDLSMRYHPLGLEGSSDVWAYPKAGYFQGLPVGAIISSNMEYVPQGDQLAALLQEEKKTQAQTEWLEDLYKRGSRGTPSPAMDPPPLLDSTVVPTGSTLDADDNFARLRMYNEYDDREQSHIALRHATLHQQR
jgi:hypothetical protein